VYLVGPWDHPGPTVAVVGARNATEDGLDVARELGRTLAGRGVAVVSGLARGIDAAAHQGSLDAGGPSGAVLGTPIDEIYPREHVWLQNALSRSLGLMSEIASGTPPTPRTFAARNRLLAAIADVTVVVQGRAGSGSLLTAKEALRLGRPVGAMPWDSREPLGEAPHELIHSGRATLVRHAEDVMALLGMGTGPAAAGRSRDVAPHLEHLTPHEAALYRALRERPRSLDHLAEAAKLTASQLTVALLTLELNGLARRAPGGLARRARITP
jgi:DNA processing protein